jgi:hypothetical protein
MTLKGKGGDRHWATCRRGCGQVLTRTVRAHLFESKSEAQAFHASVGEG